MPSARGVAVAASTAAALAVVGAVGARVGGRAILTRTERRFCARTGAPLEPLSDRARAIHAGLDVVDLHADSLLWGRDLLVRGDRGHVDLPRMVEGNVALQVFAASTKVPRTLSMERNDDRADLVILVAIANGWPPSTWRSPLERARYLAGRADALAVRSGGRFTVIRSRAHLADHRARRANDRGLTAGLLAIEGAQALEDDPANLEVLADAGYRMISPSHFFDTAFGGSAHGVVKGGLTAAGREMVERAEARGVIVDVAHASAATIDDVLAMATRPVVASHTGVRGVADNTRNLTDAQLRGIAATGGVVGIGFWDTATGGTDLAAIARSIAYAVDVAGADHVGLGSDFDGAVSTPIDAAGMVYLTDALLTAGLRRRHGREGHGRQRDARAGRRAPRLIASAGIESRAALPRSRISGDPT